MSTADRFRYSGYQTDPDRGVLTCRYELGSRSFTELITLAPGERWRLPAAVAAARLIYLLAGVSYYKTAAPPVVDLGGTAVTSTEREFLRTFYLDGLGEFSYRNDLDLSGLRIEGGTAPPATDGEPGPDGTSAPRPGPGGTAASGGAGAAAGHPGRILIPFGGGIDSIVTVETMRDRADPALFVMSQPGPRFDAIERPAAVSGLAVVRATREIDQQLLRPAALGFYNGHVPVTGILSAIAVLAAVLDGRDAVVMSNESSASAPTVISGGRGVNHQWSKSAAFETGFAGLLDQAMAGEVSYFSALRPFSELWVARRFADLPQYHGTFRSCNRAFHHDPAKRLDHWCGVCDKCCFIDLILAPFLGAPELRTIFGGAEPLGNPALAGKFRALLGFPAADAKPFECVGDTGECQAALALAVRRPDRAGTALLHTLAAELPVMPSPDAIARLLQPAGEHRIPGRYAASDLLV